MHHELLATAMREADINGPSQRLVAFLALCSGCLIVPTFGTKTEYGTRITSRDLRFVDLGITTRQGIRDRLNDSRDAFNAIGVDVYYGQTTPFLVIRLVHSCWEGFEGSPYVRLLEARCDVFKGTS